MLLRYKAQCVFFLVLWFVLVSYVRASEYHNLNVGFTVGGYPDRVHFMESALKKISKLGITQVRIYEVFDGHAGIHYQKRLKNALDILLKHGMTPLVSISNIPFEFRPQGRVKLDAIQNLPHGVRAKVDAIQHYSNRFAPQDWKQYQEAIQGLLYFLIETYGKEEVQTWWFEIGGEPDAPLYFWNDIKQFEQLYSIVSSVFVKNGLENFGGLGVTHHAVFRDKQKKRSEAYFHMMKNISRDKTGQFVSFHLYDRNKYWLTGLPAWLENTDKMIFITEWNVSSRGKVAAKYFSKQGKWGAAFIRMLADSEKYGVDRLYVFDLMDYPPFKGRAQLGLVNFEGEGKQWFSEFMSVWSVVRHGYKVLRKPSSLEIVGRAGESIILAKQTVKLSNLASLFGIQKQQIDTLQPNEWCIGKVQYE